MKKRSILTAICALLGTLTIASGCSALGGLLGGSSASESSVQVEKPTSSEKEETSSTPDVSEDPESSSTPDVSEDPESSSTPDVSEDPESSTPEDSEEPEVSTESALTILTEGEVFPYVDAAKAYLQAGAGADVADYYEKMDNPQAPIEIAWKWTATGAGKFLVEYGTEADYSDAVTVEAGARDRSIEVYNLYKATTYYVRISAFNRKGELVEKQEGEFYTTDLGPRVMNIDGICNVRDIGGYESSLGKTIQQGIAFRGGALKDKNSKLANGNWLELTEDGKKYMSEVLGIKGELDFRDENESGIKLKDGSLIPGAKLTYITAGGYQDPFKGNAGSGQKEVYRRIFSYFSNKDNYPLYMHCTAGADRTGSVVYILQAFLGVSELECAQGYEFTSFSIYGLRGESDPHNGARYKEMKELLQAYPGENLQQKAENYLLSIGVTETEIYNIKAIFFGEETIEDPNQPETPDLPEVPTGVDVTMDEMFTFDAAGTATLAEISTFIYSNGAVGYGNKAIIHMSMEKGATGNGGLRMFLGSYGLEFRGNIMRVYTIDSNGTVAEVSRDTGFKVSSYPFEQVGTLYMSVKMVDEATAALTVRVEGSQTVEFTYNFDRIGNEIAHENAKLAIYMRLDEVDSVTIYNSAAWDAQKQEN